MSNNIDAEGNPVPEEIVVVGPRFRPVSEQGILTITGWESLRLLAYDDQQPKRTNWSHVSQVRGQPTIGYGHTGTVTRADVVNGRRITKEEAIRLKALDLRDAEGKIARFVKRDVIWDLSQNQYDALVSFVYNCGLSPKWTITKRLNARRFSEVPAQMLRFVNDGGKRVQGLVNRRRAEVDMWNMADTASVPPTDLATITPEMAPAQTVWGSRTVRAAVLAGASAVGTGATAAIAQLMPHAHEGPLHYLMLILIVISTVSSFAAAAMRAADQQGEIA